MYRMLYNDSFLFDPFDETRIVSSASITTNVNAASYLDFTIAANHPLYNEIEQRSGTITLYSDNEKLFQGQITAIDMDMDGNKSVTCSSALDWLKDVQLRPYSTDQAECDEYEFKLDKAPDALDAYFQWLIDQYNAQNKDGRYFTINVNQAADLTRQSIVYFASTSPRSVADAIEDDILKTFGGYLVLRYEDDQLILDLYSDIHEMNEQVIDYGENILDISRNESTDDQYTAVYPIGKTPQYTAEQQKYHDEKAAYDERMKQREATEKAAINQLKKEEEVEQKRINGMPKGQAKKNAQNALKNRKLQRQAREQKFSDETKRLQDAQKIKDDKNAADKTKPNPITIESLDNGGYEGDLDIFKEGDVVYSVSYVARYGYKEFVYSETDVDDKNELLKLAVAKLKTLMAPVLTIDVRAVDQALYNPKHTHLFAGQAVRVRSKPHRVDEFMMVSSIDLDLIDPSQTTATLGVAYDTLTGQQSSFLRNLNSKIVASVDAVDKLGEDVKVTEITLGRVETVVDNVAADNELIVNTVGDYKWMTDTAWGKAEDAQESADEANQGVTDTNVRIDNIKMATDERIDGMETDISGIHTEIDNTKAEIVTIKENAEQIRQDAQAGIEEAKQQAEDIRTEAQTGIQEAKDKAEDVRTEANTAIDTVKTDLAATEAKAELARQNASSALGGLSSANAQINGLRIDVNRHQENITNIDGEIVGVKDTISGVAETANSALTVATTNTQAINEQSTRIDTAYSDIEATRTSVSEVKQTADGLKVNLETNYLDKDALGANYASKAELNATSESITATVEKTYATKSALEGLQNIADAAIETWSGRAVPTTSNPPASTWTTDALKRQHSGDIYYDMTTGKSYRWGSEDGTVYSWSMIADSDITKAIADAAKAQQTADGAKQDVVNLSNDVEATYTSKSEFEQTSDEIRASVNEVASVNETNTRKIAEVSVKADGISTKVAEQAETISGHTTTIGQLSVKADGLQTKFEQVSDDLGHVRGSIPGLINPNFTDGDYGWIHNGASFRISTHDASLNGPYLVGENFSENGTYELINKGLLSLTPGHKYRISILMHVNTNILQDNRLSLRFIKTYSPYVDYPNAVAYINTADITNNQFVTYSREITCPAKVTQGYFRLAAITKAGSNSYISVKSVDIVDITEGSAALTKTSELEQNINGFKQTVTESYLKKGDAETKYTSKSEFTQTANEIKGTIAEQASTINGHTTTIGQLSVKADGLQTKFEQVSDASNMALQRSENLIIDGGFENPAYWSIDPPDYIQVNADGPHSGKNILHLTPRSGNGTIYLVHGYGSSVRKLIDVVPGRTYEASFWYKNSSTAAWGPSNTKFRIGNASGAFLYEVRITDKSTPWKQCTGRFKVPDNVQQIELAIMTGVTAGIVAIDDVSFTDVTDAVNNESTLLRTSELEQNLNGFKQTVTESYLKKGDAETKYTSKSEFTQTANEIKGTVAEQATTINGHTDSIANLSLKANKFETDITQVTEQATAIAGRTTKLEQDLGGFKQTVSGTYITKTDAEQNLVDAINDIQIGGSNMLLDTQKFGQANPNNVDDAYGRLININAATSTGSTNMESTKYANGFVWRGIPSSNTTNNPDGARYQVTVKPGGVYTFSFEAFTTAGFWVYFYGPNGYIKVKKTICSTGTPLNGTNGDGAVQFNSTGAKWAHHEITWELDSTGSTNLKYVLFRRVGSTGYTTFIAPKLEEGNKATEWSPSPFDTLYASTITSTYAPKIMVQQTEDRITQTAEAKYATKTQLSDEMRQSLKTLELRGRQDGNYWLKLGRVTMAQQGKDFHIDYTGGRGFNGDTSQNAQLEIHVRSSNGGGRLFAVTLNRLLNADMHTVKAFAIDSTHIDLYMTGGGQYSTGTMAYYGQYTDFSGAKQIEDISTAEGTELTVLEQSLSTKSYVRQTAESVSIDVVEDFKDGKHGDKLTTQSNLTALKDEINIGVSEKYADLSDQIKLANSDNAVGKNFSFESNNFDGWGSHDKWTIGVNGAHTGRYYAQNTIPAGSNGNQLISMGSIAAEYGHTYKLEYWAKKKPNTQCRGLHRISYKRSGVWEDMPSDYTTTMFRDENGTTNITSGRDYFDVTDSWMKVTTYIIPPSNVTDIRVRIIGNNPGSAETVYAVDDVSLSDYSVAKTINKTMAGINVKADSIVQEVRNDYATKDLVNRSIPGLKNPNFDVQKDGDYYTIAGWSVLGSWAETRLGNSSPVSSSEGGTYFIGKSGTTAGQTLELINQGYISAYPGMKVQISWWMFVDANIIQNSNFSAGIIANNVVTRNLLNNYSTGGWKYMTTTVEVPANVNQFRVRFGFVTTGTSGWLRLDSVSVTDVTEAKAAMGKANTAVSTLDAFKRTVENSYVTNDKLTKVQTDWKQTTDGFEANISSISKSIPVVDPGFESNGDGWRTCRIGNTLVEDNISLSGGIISNVLGNNTKSLYISVNQTRVSNSGRIIAGDNNILMVSGRFCAINSNGGAVSGVTVTPGLLGRHNSVPYTGTQQTSSSGWTTFRVPMKVYAGTYSVLFTFGNLGGNRIVLDDINLENNTEGASARKDIDDLNTRIAMTSEGVRVGKIVNNKFQGGNVLMNANDGSFDILNGDEARNRFTSDSIDLIKNDSGYQFSIKPFTRTGTGTVITELKGVNLISQGVFALNSIPATPATVSIPINSGDGKLPADKIPSWQMNNIKNSYYQRVTIPFQASAKAYHDQFYANLDNGIPPSIEVFQYPVFRVAAIDGETTVSNRTLMITAPGLYAIQGQFNAQKPSSNAICDVILKAKKYNESDYVEIAFPYRFSEVSDPIGWTTKASQTFYVYLDAGTRIIWQYVMSGGTFTIGGGNNFTVTRMPFSGIDMR